MRRLWIANDIYEALREEAAPAPISVLLRGLLGLQLHPYKSSPTRKSEAVRKGLERARRKGVILGRPKYPEYAREKVRTQKKRGWTLSQIGQDQGMSQSTVKRILQER